MKLEGFSKYHSKIILKGDKDIRRVKVTTTIRYSTYLQEILDLQDSQLKFLAERETLLETHSSPDSDSQLKEYVNEKIHIATLHFEYARLKVRELIEKLLTELEVEENSKNSFWYDLQKSSEILDHYLAFPSCDIPQKDLASLESFLQTLGAEYDFPFHPLVKKEISIVNSLWNQELYKPLETAG